MALAPFSISAMKLDTHYFAHNFTSSANGRTSVMDYPHPNIELKNGSISISNAYEKGTVNGIK